jgi:hypothetical protein
LRHGSRPTAHRDRHAAPRAKFAATVRENSFSKNFPTPSSIERRNPQCRFSRLPTAIASRDIGRVGSNQLVAVWVKLNSRSWPSTFPSKLFPLERWQSFGARFASTRLVLPGGLLSIGSGNFCCSIPDFAATGAICLFTTIPRAPESRWISISACRSRVHSRTKEKCSPAGNVFQRVVNGSHKPDAGVGTFLAIPVIGSFEFLPCLWVKVIWLSGRHRTAGRQAAAALPRTESSEPCPNQFPRYGA